MATAIAQPKVITIQPEFSALEFLSNTPATTPSPRMIRIMVPINSPIYASIYPSSLERSSGSDVARRPEVVFHLVVELEQGYREPGHLQRGHVVPDVGHPPDLDPLALQDVRHVGVGDVELHERGPAHAVDHHGNLGTREVHGVAEDAAHHLVHYLVGGLHLFALNTRLAVDAYTDLHLVVGDIEDGLAALGRGAARERHTHRTDVAVDPLCQLLDAGKIPAVVRGGAADLVYEDGAGDTAPPAGERRVLDGHVVVGDHVVGLYPLRLGELARHLEVEHVARVVLDDVEDPRTAVDGLGRLEHLVRGWAGEDGAGAGGVEHARSDEAAVGRLVARAAAGDEGHLALHGGVGADDDAVLGNHPDQARVRQLHPPQHLVDDPLGRVDDFLHVSLSSVCRLGERGLDGFLGPILGPGYGLLPPAVEPLALLLAHLRLVAAPETPPALDLVAVLPEADREPGKIRGTERRGLQRLGHLDRRPEDVRLELHHPAVGRGPAVCLEGRDVYARVRLHRLDGVAGLVAHALERGPREVRPRAAAREPEDGAPGVRVPVWGSETDEGR